MLNYAQAANLISHLKGDYQNWYNNLSAEEKKETNNWSEFVKQSVKVNNDNNGTEEDFVFIAEDAISKFNTQTT